MGDLPIIKPCALQGFMADHLTVVVVVVVVAGLCRRTTGRMHTTVTVMQFKSASKRAIGSHAIICQQTHSFGGMVENA